ncbi:hypothetical protein N7527_006143 [Penicillium freii]|uniref:Uncharacterized protein n=1 Tax=Penicillium freii TaxID=48697 RepID=A0A117NLD1_PENFR|nr:hypothetical protein N7527_006143 [Penicillium freii]KUM57533.1 hypothetical protein ACN42_g9651 [Penicillium freii]
MELSIIYYLSLLLLFGYFVVYHFPHTNSIPPSPSESASIDDPNDQVEELDPDKFYHHPVWPQRWHHPMLTKEASAKWWQEPWFKNAADRRSRQFLPRRLPCYFPWGYIIYRTVYTPESEELWPIVMKRMAHQLNRGIECELDHPRELHGDESRPEQLIEESHKDVVISDPSRWDGASIEQVRGHFAVYLRKIKQEDYSEESHFASCLVVDERSLKSIAKDDRNGFVGVVDGRYNPEERYDNPSYRGFMRVQIKALWDLYVNYDWEPMSTLCPKHPDGWIPVYNGCYGTVQDEDGNDYPENYAQHRPEGLAGRGRG